MTDQKLAQAVRDRDLAVRRACLRRVLNDKVRFLLRIVIQNLNGLDSLEKRPLLEHGSDFS